MKRLILVLTVALGLVAAYAVAKPGWMKQSIPVTTLVSQNGSMDVSDSLFAEHPEDPVLFWNTLGTKGYDPPCFKVSNTDGSPIKPQESSTILAMDVCALVKVYNPNPVCNVTLKAPFEFKGVITYEPDYALSFKPFPRYVIKLSTNP